MSRNKYKRQARAARRDWQRWRMCDRKRRYDTEAEAQQKGQRTYRCPICKKWHRSGQEAELLATVKNRFDKCDCKQSANLHFRPVNDPTHDAEA